jgi:hypothetical protein
MENQVLMLVALATLGCGTPNVLPCTNCDAGQAQDAGTDMPTDAGVDAGVDAGLPFVRFVSPAAGATVANPVTFTIEASGVDEVQIFADQTYALGPAWDPSVRSTLTYRFAGTGIPRPLSVVGRVGGRDVVRAELTITISPDSCEDRFFVSEFNARNVDPTGTIDLAALREDSLAAIKAEVAELGSCGATVTLGGMMSLLLYEGAFRAAAFNTLCLENSYNRVATDCDAVAEALYSYQFGIGAIHTSNFHPCKGGAYTQSMRQLFLQRAQAAGFSVDPGLMTPALTTRFHTVCPSATPNAVDYYLLGAHEVFGIPKNASGNFLAGYGRFPLFTPRISIAMSFHELSVSCANLHSDRDAIRIFGGADASYGTTTKQDQILSYFNNYKTANCP